MNILSIPTEMISRGGSSAVAGVLLLAAACLVLLVAALSVKRIATFAGTKVEKVTGRVTRKYVIPAHREWQGKAYVAVPEENALEIEVKNRPLQFSPVGWKYARVSEGDEIDVALQRGRFGKEIRILDIGPF